MKRVAPRSCAKRVRRRETSASNATSRRPPRKGLDCRPRMVGRQVEERRACRRGASRASRDSSRSSRSPSSCARCPRGEVGVADRGGVMFRHRSRRRAERRRPCRADGRASRTTRRSVAMWWIVRTRKCSSSSRRRSSARNGRSRRRSNGRRASSRARRRASSSAAAGVVVPFVPLRGDGPEVDHFQPEDRPANEAPEQAGRRSVSKVVRSAPVGGDYRRQAPLQGRPASRGPSRRNTRGRL